METSETENPYGEHARHRPTLDDARGKTHGACAVYLFTAGRFVSQVRVRLLGAKPRIHNRVETSPSEKTSGFGAY